MEKSNIFNISVENLKFLKIFQTLGFLPIKLKSNESDFSKLASFAIFVLAILMLIARYFLKPVDLALVILFAFDSGLFMLSQLLSWFMHERQKTFLRILGEIDGKIVDILGMGDSLRKQNVKMQRNFVTVWIIFAVASLYFPSIKYVHENHSPAFFDSLFRALSWSILINLKYLKIYYDYAIIVVRLEIIKKCLIELQNDKVQKLKNLVLVREIQRDKFGTNFPLHSKIKALKEIYERCWLLQGHACSLSQVFIILGLVSYFGHLVYLIFDSMKEAMLENKLIDELFDILLWLILLNFFMIKFFIISHKMYTTRLKIAGLIHYIAHNFIDDLKISQSVMMFSLQIMQQEITTISAFELFYFDRTNISAVSFNQNLSTHRNFI